MPFGPEKNGLKYMDAPEDLPPDGYGNAFSLQVRKTPGTPPADALDIICAGPLIRKGKGMPLLFCLRSRRLGAI